MAVADDCIPQLQACRIRVADLGATGAPVIGAGHVYVTDAFQKVTLSPQYQDGDEITEKNACGATFIDFLADPSFTRVDISLDLLTPDPYLHKMLVAGSVLLTLGDTSVGWAFPPVGEVTGNGVSIEVWCKRVSDGALSQVHPYAHWAMPLVRSMRVGDKEFSSTAQHSLLTGQCNENANWGDGPGNDFDAESDRCAQWIPTDTLPDVSCGPLASIAS